jgi:SAM-dependent methyltransferase
MESVDDLTFQPFLERFELGEWRAPIFRDLVLSEFSRIGIRKEDATLLDIGCGHGFDMDGRIQGQLAAGSRQYVGVEPDAEMVTASFIAPVHRCFFEQAPIPANSVDIAFAVMVLEHLPQPQAFWDKLYEVLRPGGVFWGFTVNAHHPFATLSAVAGKAKLKDSYLNWLLGRRSEDRYENYPTFYRSNKSEDIEKQAQRFASTQCLHFTRKREMNAYLPKALHGLGGMYDMAAPLIGWPGSAVMAVRAAK